MHSLAQFMVISAIQCNKIWGKCFCGLGREVQKMDSLTVDTPTFLGAPTQFHVTLSSVKNARKVNWPENWPVTHSLNLSSLLFDQLPPSDWALNWFSPSLEITLILWIYTPILGLGYSNLPSLYYPLYAFLNLESLNPFSLRSHPPIVIQAARLRKWRGHLSNCDRIQKRKALSQPKTS